MIEIKNVDKAFDKSKVLSNISFNIKENETFGLIGTNGAGKSTMLRIIAGIYNVDKGEVLIDGTNVKKNPYCKNEVFYVSDEQYYFPNANIKELIDYYSLYYSKFDKEKAKKIFNDFELDINKKIKTFSKGMKKQVFIVLALCSNAKYILLDETFDGLDPVMREAVKKLIMTNMHERDFTPIIASHSLRELEDICKNICLLHKGEIILSDNLDNMKLGLHRVQLVFTENSDMKILDELNIMKKEQRGRVWTLTIKGEEKYINDTINKMNCMFYEMLPLTLEEMFISETEGVGYDVKSLTL